MPASLIPLKQWYCDSCGEVIQKPEDGYLEWKDDPQPGQQKRAGFRIVHHAPRSPRRKKGGDCYYSDADSGGDSALSKFLGSDGLIALTAWIDVGEEKDSEYKGPYVGDLREWTVLVRRLQVPYYEEARKYLSRAHDDHFGEANEVTFYLPSTLKEIIEKYRQKDEE